jgi:hypothetical protein
MLKKKKRCRVEQLAGGAVVFVRYTFAVAVVRRAAGMLAWG